MLHNRPLTDWRQLLHDLIILVVVILVVGMFVEFGSFIAEEQMRKRMFEICSDPFNNNFVIENKPGKWHCSESATLIDGTF